MNNKQTKQLDEFLKYLTKLQPEEFLGVCRILGVKLGEQVEEEVKPRAFEDVLYEVLVNFEKLNRAKRRELLQVVKAAQK